MQRICSWNLAGQVGFMQGPDTVFFIHLQMSLCSLSLSGNSKFLFYGCVCSSIMDQELCGLSVISVSFNPNLSTGVVGKMRNDFPQWRGEGGRVEKTYELLPQGP